MKSTSDIYRYDGRLLLESGAYLDYPEIKYSTFGERSEKGDNTIWILHALTANDNPVDWWPGVVGPGCVIDTSRYHVVCASALGGHYGSTHPLSLNPATGEPYYDSFPVLTNRDIVHGFDLLRQHLQIDQVQCLIGSSLGGQQAQEWLIEQPGVFHSALLIATNAVHSPWGIAFNESQRMAIRADQTYGEARPDAGAAGLAAARSIALLSYRTSTGYNTTQRDDSGHLTDFRASSYQRYQGKKLTRRYDAYSYYRLTQAMDSHDVGRGRGSVERALAEITTRVTVVGIDSDILFPLEEQWRLHEGIVASTMYEISSDFGHDGFLVEADQMRPIIDQVLAVSLSPLSVKEGV